MSSQNRTVFSTDPKDKVHCGHCRKLLSDCKCRPEDNVHLTQITAVFRIEKNGRGGKTVTILDALPKNEEFLKALTKEFKVKCGTGGTYKMDQKTGQIEIQGDQRGPMKALLDAKRIKFKGV